jgi:hypothetical protein
MKIELWLEITRKKQEMFWKKERKKMDKTKESKKMILFLIMSSVIPSVYSL